MSYFRFHPIIHAWLKATAPGPPTPADPTDQPTSEDEEELPFTPNPTPFVPPPPSGATRFNPRSTRSSSDQSELSISSSVTLNSVHRSTFELLKSLPAPWDVQAVLPHLPTYSATPAELVSILPNDIDMPLVCYYSPTFHNLVNSYQTIIQAPHLFESNFPAAIEAEYSRVLDLRERLRVEEITLEMQTDMHRLYLDPPVYHTSQEHLATVRLLIRRACQSLLYIQGECDKRKLYLDIPSIYQRRTLNRPPDHPYNMIASYLKPEAQEQFHNYDIFFDIYTIDEEDRPSERILSAPSLTESTETTESSMSESSDEYLGSSDYSLVPSIGGYSTPFIPTVVEVDHNPHTDIDSLSAHTDWPDTLIAELSLQEVGEKSMQHALSLLPRAEVM